MNRNMPDYFTIVAISYSVGFAAIIGIVRYKRILKIYRPFVLITTVAFINEILSTIFTAIYKTNSVNANIYLLIESSLFVWQFKNWGAFPKRQWLFHASLCLLVIIWIYDNFFFSTITYTNSIFSICSSFILIFLSIDRINKLIVEERGNILRNASFLISIGIICYYSYNATIEVFYLMKLKMSQQFFLNIFWILVFVNLFVNLIYALASLWIPTKQKFTLPS
jgi:hypothetical protein